MPLRNFETSNRFNHLRRRDPLRTGRGEACGDQAQSWGSKEEEWWNTSFLDSPSTTRTRIINPCTVYLVSTYLWLRFFFLISYLSPPFLPQSAPSPFGASFARAPSRVGWLRGYEGTQRLRPAILVPTREAWTAGYMCASTYVIFYVVSASRFGGGTEYRMYRRCYRNCAGLRDPPCLRDLSYGRYIFSCVQKIFLEKFCQEYSWHVIFFMISSKKICEKYIRLFSCYFHMQNK